LTHYPESNPELRLNNFPKGYKLVDEIPYRSKLECQDYETLTQQLSYMMLIPAENNLVFLKDYLTETIDKPIINFNQTVDIYQKQ